MKLVGASHSLVEELEAVMRHATKAILILACIAGVSHAAAEDSSEVAESRIRMFGQNGAFADLHAGSDCIKREGRERVSGSLGSAFGSLVGKVSNVSLGMPETITSRNLSQRDGIFSKAYFREFVIPAGMPTSLQLGFQDVSNFYSANGVTYGSVSPSCKGAISFVPDAGKDYEVGFSWQGRTCYLSVNEIVQEGSETRLIPVQVKEAPKCR